MMSGPSGERLIALTARLGTVEGLERFVSQVDQITGQLVLSPRLRRAELNELKQGLRIAGETICQLRNALTHHLRALGAEKNHGC
jgi:hypothetical protein